jgi:hypothetical protein
MPPEMMLGDFSSYNDMFPGLGYGFPREIDFSPVTYLDSIMNGRRPRPYMWVPLTAAVPLFNYPEA